MMDKQRIRVTRLFLCAIAGLAAACSVAERPPYRVPAGDIRYTPERGIYREGATVDESEEALFQRGKSAFDKGNFAEAQEVFHTLRTSQEYADGARALDAIVLETIAALERGSDAVWRVEDVANAFHGDKGAVSRVPENLLTREQADTLRSVAFRLSDRRALEESWRITEEILIYYAAGLGVVANIHLRVEQHARNIAWYAYLARNYELAELVTRTLIDRDPNKRIKEQTQMIQADTAYAVEYFEKSRETYADVYKNSRDPDMREDALLGEVRSMLASSKGWEYDATLYEDIHNKIEQDYKLDLLQRSPSKRRYKEFSEIEKVVNGVLHRKYLESAETFERLFDEKAAEWYRAKAEDFRKLADEAEKDLAQ
ncbi:MAG: hypothetical protein L6Q71_07445 [Planctomycetes bacterium]|nr:hypothetical protein [Planctomycetota bacterium]NUQ35490.1 hypothetical protein [Planctomycetaceae bacterium]